MISRADEGERPARAAAFDGQRRVVIGAVRPSLDGGRFAVKRVIGDVLDVEAELLLDGHDLIAAVVRHRAPDGATSEQPLVALGNDRWHGAIPLSQLGRWSYSVEAWVDAWASFVWGFRRKVDAAQDVRVELLDGAKLIVAAVERARAQGDGARDDGNALAALAARVADERRAPAERIAAVTDAATTALMARHPDRSHAARLERALEVVVEPMRARFSAWYEFFPRSCGENGRHGTFADAAKRLDYVADLGFDTVYLPPIHPIGRTHRKGPNNSLGSNANDVGSPWAIGASEGGHKSIHPQLGTLDDFRAFVARAKTLGLEVALDIALQVSPDHPYVKQHPDWFVQRADGSIQYAENPPKKYQDIYPFHFDCADWKALWNELKSIFLFWIEQGITVFRVDNPHTKPLPFWQWCIGEIQRQHPETIFLAEAFTRPKLLQALAKAGFSQSYTYFTWRTTKAELTEYAEELTQTAQYDYLRPNFWPNTPDILPEHLQWGGRAAYLQRLILASTLSSNWGVYGPTFELMEHVARPGAEEYLDNEKYQLRQWDLTRADSLAPMMKLLNRIRREQPALHDNATLRFHRTDNEFVICYSKRSADDMGGAILVVVNLDPEHTQSAWIDVDAAALGVAPDETFQVHDLLGEARYRWRAGRNFVQLIPQVMPAHLFRIRRHAASERGFEYFI